MYRLRRLRPGAGRASASRSSATRSRRRLSGELTEDEFKPLRLMNGLYLQLHAYMLRIAIPYGTLSSRQMRMLAHVARRYDRGYGHFTTRQNIQFNWIKLEELPDAHGRARARRTARHADQRQLRAQHHHRSMGRRRARRDRGPAHLGRDHAPAGRRCIRNSPSCRASSRSRVTAAAHDRAAVAVHDIGLRLHRNGAGEIGFEVDRRRRARPHAVHRQDHQAVPAASAIC